MIWKQCPWCARWFIATHGNTKYDSAKCRQNMNAKIYNMRNGSSYHYVSIRGEMYDRVDTV